MAELVRTNDLGVISAIEGMLGGADIPYQVTYRNMSVLEGSIIAIQMRILVPDDHEAEARELLVDASATGCALDPGAVARLRGMQGASCRLPSEGLLARGRDLRDRYFQPLRPCGKLALMCKLVACRL